MAAASSTDPAAWELGHRVRVRRTVLDWSRERLAEEAGLHVNYIGAVERGERNIGLKSILHLARALEVRPGELLDGLDSYDLDS